ncbi:hypothetical protein [Undibacterium sp. 10I3]|uniref:hypothetical protein n=1 Tax=Undibacterium sp. 10I3 TaxID=3048579 RepID=UPI002B22422F|nr:hypothetical protein [Undibacterium sp. 10I3]MEB0229341.1 hypothetical protein [Undibacterium sp. 10I3]
MGSIFNSGFLLDRYHSAKNADGIRCSEVQHRRDLSVSATATIAPLANCLASSSRAASQSAKGTLVAVPMKTLGLKIDEIRFKKTEWTIAKLNKSPAS